MVFNDSFLLLPSDYKPIVLLSKSISLVDIMLNSELYAKISLFGAFVCVLKWTVNLKDVLEIRRISRSNICDRCIDCNLWIV